jgi:hypothetical protein
MSLLRGGGANYMPVRDLSAATRWYKEKFGLREIDIDMDEPEGCIALGFSKNPDDYAFTLGPIGKPTDELNPRLFTSNIKKAHEFLISCGVNTEEIQQDGQGTRFFTIRDLESNAIEISEEP